MPTSPIRAWLAIATLALGSCSGTCGKQAEPDREAAAQEVGKASADATSTGDAGAAGKAGARTATSPDPVFALAIKGGDFSEDLITLKTSERIASWVYDPESRRTIVKMNGTTEGRRIRFTAKLPLASTGTFECDAGEAGIDGRVLLHVHAGKGGGRTTYAASECKVEIATHDPESGSIAGTFSGEFVKRKRNGRGGSPTKAADASEEAPTKLTVARGKFRAPWRDFLGGNGQRWP